MSMCVRAVVCVGVCRPDAVCLCVRGWWCVSVCAALMQYVCLPVQVTMAMRQALNYIKPCTLARSVMLRHVTPCYVMLRHF